MKQQIPVCTALQLDKLMRACRWQMQCPGQGMSGLNMPDANLCGTCDNYANGEGKYHNSNTSGRCSMSGKNNFLHNMPCMQIASYIMCINICYE